MVDNAKVESRKWSGRVLTSLCTMVSFILLIVTAIILYVEPHGRVAYWTEWQFWGLEKDQWGNIHIFSGLLFFIAGGFHVYFNWKALIRYLSGKIGTGLRYKRELIVSGLILLWVLFSGIFSLPPLSYITDVGETIKESWVTSPELEPPFGHAELVSLQTFCVKQRIPLDEAMAALRDAGFKIDSPKATLQEIAKSKNMAAMGVYEVIHKLEVKPEPMKPGESWTPEKIEETFSGTGLGQKTIAKILEDLNVDPNVALQRLKENGIEAEEGAKLKALADKNSTTPIKLLNIILLGKP